MKKILFLGIMILMIGCKNTNLCGQKDWSITSNEKLKKEYISYFSNKNDNHTEIGQRSVPLIADHHQVLKKQQNEFRYFEEVSLFGGLVAQGDNISTFNSNGDNLTKSAQINFLCGILSSFKVKILVGEERPTASSYEETFLAGLLYSEKLFIDSKKNVTQDMDFMLKAFGSSRRADGSEFITLFWIPIKTSD